MSPLIDYQAAAALLGVKVPTLRSLVCRGQVPCVRITGRIVRFDPAELEAWIAARRVAAGGAK